MLSCKQQLHGGNCLASTASVCAVFPLGCFWGGVHPYCANISVSEAAAFPIRMMACKVNLHSIIISKELYTRKYAAINCTIVTLVEDRH